MDTFACISGTIKERKSGENRFLGNFNADNIAEYEAEYFGVAILEKVVKMWFSTYIFGGVRGRNLGKKANL